MKILIEILYNLGMLVSLSIISGFIGHKWKTGWSRSLSQGAIFGIASMIGMLHPLILAPGLIFDGRSVMISLAGYFFGPLAAAVAGSLALMLRVYQGGSGAVMGVLVIVSSALIGVTFRQWLRKGSGQDNSLGVLFCMGVAVHITMVLLMFTLPADKAVSTIKSMAIPVMLAYPLATVLIGRILSESKARRILTEELHISQSELKEANGHLEASLKELISRGDELHKQYELLAASEYSFRKLFEGSADAIIIFKDIGIIDCNQAAADLFSLGMKEGILGKMIWEISTERQADGQLSEVKAEELIQLCIRNSNIRFEWTHLRGDGTIMNVEVVMTSIILNGEKVFHALVRDMSERKAMVEKLEQMSYHDQLTGVYNRHFFEEELNRLDVKRNLPFTIMMGDVNGLKLVNDSFGHAFGDQLLRKVADLIKKGCREDDIVSRIGGDEFIVLFPQTGSNEVEEIEKRIQHMAATDKVGSLDISISFGWSTKFTEDESIDEVLKKAEDYLYQKKLFESPSMRGRTIHTIIHTLHEKNKGEEEHSLRVSLLCESMGIAMGLPESKVKELKHVGLLHDIGKIAIDEQMLTKPGKLTADEWDDMARHPAIGYRILSTVNEMAEMAEYVLAHHERWDGTGYPKGLKADEIPFEARIISLADAFDAMTSDRPFKKAMSKDASIEQLILHSGTQFDPQLVTIFVEMLTNPGTAETIIDLC